MRRFALLALLSIVVVTATSSSAFAQKGAPVYVTNAGATKDTPVPVSGSVQISGTPSVSVVNTPSVNLAPGATVSVSSMPTVAGSVNATITNAAVPITGDITNPGVPTTSANARNIVRLIAGGDTETSGQLATLLNGSSFTVPDHKRLVIDNVSVFSYVTTGNMLDLGFYTHAPVGPGAWVGFWVFPDLRKSYTNNGLDFYYWNSTTPWYVDAGQPVEVSFGWNGGNTHHYNIYFQGYLEDCGGTCQQQ